MSKNKVQAVSCAKITDKTVVSTSIASPVTDLVLRQNVLARGEGKRFSTDCEHNVLKLGVTTSRDHHQSCCGICVCSFDVLIKSIESAGLEVNKGSSGINNTRKARSNRGGAVCNFRNIDTPVGLQVEVIKALAHFFICLCSVIINVSLTFEGDLDVMGV